MQEYIITVSGVRFTPLSPKKEDIHIGDIAHALSMMTRANGHFREFYSVGQHSLDCAMLSVAEGRNDREILACLLHDASEAYLSDITRPVKARLPEYRQIESVLQKAIYEKYIPGGLTEREEQIVKRIDDTCLYYEFEHFTGVKLYEEPPRITQMPTYEAKSFFEVEQRFLQVFKKLEGGVA